jgi:hypothetical protein
MLARIMAAGPVTDGRLYIYDIFSWKVLGIHTSKGWLVIATNLGTACLEAVYLMWIVSPADLPDLFQIYVPM